MGVSSKIESISRDVELLLAEEISPEARSAALAQFAAEEIAAAQALNRAALGRDGETEIFVDGRADAPLASVRPDGVIVAEFGLVLEVFAWVAAQLVSHSPKRSGRYAQSHAFYVDGNEADPLGAVPDGSEYVFVSMVPYARKIENGLSRQAPDGVYQAVAAVASRRFGNIAKVYFGYRSVRGGDVGQWAGRTKMASHKPGLNTAGPRRTDWLTRQPAIVIRIQ